MKCKLSLSAVALMSTQALMNAVTISKEDFI
jgi:hypothetical protein